MKRPLHTWIAFCLCLAVVLGAMGWVSLTALRLDRSEVEARRRAALEENVRLALWRMDSALGDLIARENARPYFAYTAFYPADRAYTRMFARIRPGEVLMPSPLLTGFSPHILLHFQFGPDGELTSPQVPTGNMRDLAETGYTTHEKIEASAALLRELQGTVRREPLLELLPVETDQRAEPPLAAQAWGEQSLPRGAEQAEQQQQERNIIEQQARVRLQRATIAPKAATGYSDVREGVIAPVWAGSMLLLARRVRVGEQDYVQGCWVDWPAIRLWLLDQVRDLFADADLEPVESGAGEWQSRMLTAVPARLVPGSAPPVETGPVWPIRFSLLIAWGCVLLAAAAVAVLLLGAVSLSERRGAFVSAVTHELRSPLTTFRMYTEMLAEGMVPGEAKRQRYLETLRTEAERLAHLVENVLAYARLERQRAGAGVEAVTVQGLLERIQGRLTERARQAGMDLIVDGAEKAASLTVRADTSAVEQILFNLVDNACKYAALASDRRIRLQIDSAGSFALLKIRDRGPGIARKDARRLFRPFSKSAREAANSAPGVGLGLALCRRLARRMGGDLRLDRNVDDGTCFVLSLPMAPSL